MLARPKLSQFHKYESRAEKARCAFPVRTHWSVEFSTGLKIRTRPDAQVFKARTRRSPTHQHEPVGPARPVESSACNRANVTSIPLKSLYYPNYLITGCTTLSRSLCPSVSLSTPCPCCCLHPQPAVAGGLLSQKTWRLQQSLQ